jgi:hypothetical protein
LHARKRAQGVVNKQKLFQQKIAATLPPPRQKQNKINTNKFSDSMQNFI